MIKIWRNITASGADQLRKLATNVEGMSLAGRNEGALSKGTESTIVLRVVSNRARVYWDEKEKEDGEGKGRGGCYVESSQLHGGWLIVHYTMRCRLTTSRHSRLSPLLVMRSQPSYTGHSHPARLLE
jgi:hypothetical protein